MPRDIVPSREGPRREIATELEKHDKVWGDKPVRAQNKAEAEIAARKTTQEEARERDFRRAAEHLSKLSYAQTLDYFHALPMGLLELNLLVEEATKNRPEVLRYFPKPGVKARERYAPFMDKPATVDA